MKNNEIINAVSNAIKADKVTGSCPKKRTFHGIWYETFNGIWYEIVLPAGDDASFYVSIPEEAYDYLKNMKEIK